MSTASAFQLRFTVGSDERLRALVCAYDHVRECKAKDQWPDKKEDWTPYFDSRALSHFWWPTEEELEEWKKRYFATPWAKRPTDPSLQHPWDFMSLFDAFRNGDYTLLPMEKLSEKQAILPFDPLGHPYGGTGCMRALIEAFDHQVTEEPE